MLVPTTTALYFKDPDKYPPPRHNKLIVLSRYGVASIGTFAKGFHVGWVELPKIPEAIKEKMFTSQR